MPCLQQTPHNDFIGGDAFNSFYSDGPLVLFQNLFMQHMTGQPLSPYLSEKLEKHILSQNIINLPRASAAYNDYTTQDKRRVACFEGTREALLEEIAEWILSVAGPRLYLLWGIAGVGKSTVAQTVAERADHLHFLGASFFFSRNEIDRKNARMFFTTIAFHLCVYNQDFARAIGEVLLTERGCAATSKEPLEQLNTLILEPLRNLIHQFVLPIVIVVDALDECDDQDGPTIFIGLANLVRELPFFRVILTSRPQLHLQHLIRNPNTQTETEFHLQNIEDKIVDNDIRLYLEHSLSPEQVQRRLPGLRYQWSASHQEIAFLVRAAGRLFIIASTAVLFILDKAARHPENRMKTLQDRFTQNRTPLNALNEFYTVILRSTVPESCDRGIVKQYQLVVGTIILVQDLLAVEALAVLIGLSKESVYAVLDNLQSVISIGGKDLPRVYHKSFPDYLTDDTRCSDDNLRIVPRAHHTRIATRCLQLMNKHLKRNVLDLGTPARFMDNNDGLAYQNIPAEKLAEMIPDELQYACVYWANHVKGADAEDVNLIKEVVTFVKEHLLHWLEALSWIDKLEVAYPAVRVIAQSTKTTSSDMNAIISGALRFIPRFYGRIRQSALHTYYSALPFTPTDCLLHKHYSGETIHGLCRLQGVQSRWDAMITYFKPLSDVADLVFSPDGSKFASSSRTQKGTRLWDAENGAVFRTYEGDRTAIANDFSVASVSKSRAVTLWSVANNVPVTTITQSDEVVRLALSYDGAVLAVGLANGTVSLWDARNNELMANLDGYACEDRNKPDACKLEFSQKGYKLAFMSDNGTIQLWNGDGGGSITRLDYESKKHVIFVFSRDGRRIASLVKEDGGYSLTLWDAENGIFIGVAQNARGALGILEELTLAISEDGSLIATAGLGTVRLWSGNSISLVHTFNDINSEGYLAISHGILACGWGGITLYDVNNYAVIAELKDYLCTSLALSPDHSRLAVVDHANGWLFDVTLLRLVHTSMHKHERSVYYLAFSPDCSRLASGFDNGVVALWDTNITERPINSHYLHFSSITALAFTPDGERFASSSRDKTIRFWNGKDGEPISKLEHSFTEEPGEIAISHNLLAAATRSDITLFNHRSLCPANTLGGGGQSLSFSSDGSLLASARDSHKDVIVWNVAERVAIARFAEELGTRRLTFSPDNSQLIIESWHRGCKFFDIVNKHPFEFMGRENLSWVPNLMNGMLISMGYDALRGDHLLGQFPGCREQVSLLWIPEEFEVESFAVGSSIVAFGSHSGQILFARFPTTSIN